MKRYLTHYPIASPARMAAERSAQFIREAAAKHFRGRMLDLGCGSKWKFDLVGDLVEEYVGLDHKDSMHDQSVVDIFGTAYEIPEPDEAFDCILCTSVLEHLEEPGTALRESLRVLKPGGHAIYTVPLFWHLHEQPRDFYRHTSYGLEYNFTSAGWEIVSLEPMSGFWLTAATELNYYLLASWPRVLRPAVRALTMASNLIVPTFDRIDTRLNPKSREWSWMYIVVASRPAETSTGSGR